MPREGTRSQTGNSRPRIFHTVDTGPATPRKKAAKQSGGGALPSLKSRLTARGPSDKHKAKKNGSAGAGGVMDKVRSAVGLEPREPKKVQKKGSVKRAVQKVKAAAKIDDKEKKVRSSPLA